MSTYFSLHQICPHFDTDKSQIPLRFVSKVFSHDKTVIKVLLCFVTPTTHKRNNPLKYADKSSVEN